MSEQKPTELRSHNIAGQYAELVLSPGFRKINDRAAEMADNDGDTYRQWRENMDEHLGGLAASIVDKEDLEGEVWQHQRQVALSLLEDKQLGPFADYSFSLTVGGRAAEVEPSSIEYPVLPPGEPEIVATNTRVRSLAENTEEPMEFLRSALGYIKHRRQKGNDYEGPENYATALKFFTDKTFDHPVMDQSSMDAARKLVTEGIGNFLRISERDEPNLIEITNILSTIKNLPPDMLDKRLSAGVLTHVLKLMDDFSQRGLNVLIGALGKIDSEQCAEPAAMVLDLALRKGSKMDRSGDMLSALRAVANLPKTTASERTFTTLLDVRNALELSSDLESLREVNKLLRQIVDNVTESKADSLRAKQLAEAVARRAVDLYKNVVQASAGDTELARKSVASIISDAKAI